MKTKTIYTTLALGLLLCGTGTAAPAPETAAPSQPGTATMTPRTGINPVVVPNETVRNGVIQPNGNIQTGPNGQFGQTATSQTTVSSNTAAGTTNQFAGTNGFPQTNNFAGVNGTNDVTAIVNPMTNFPVTVNSNFNGNIVMQDQAVTPSDRILLTTLSQGVRATLGIVPNGNTPVHFLIQNGTVTVVGTVQSTAQSQAVLSQVQQTPGVLSVINGMHVSGPYAPAVQNQGGSSVSLGVPVDRAFSPRDQTLLTTVQQEAAMQLGVTSTAQMPVHFSIENGVVGVTGQVNSFQEKQALIGAIQRTHGIVRVVDNVAVVSTAPLTGTSGNVGGTVNGTLTPTSSGNAQSNIYLNTTNSSGF